MRSMKIILQLVLTAAVIISIFAAPAYSEQIQGRLKSLAEDAMVFTLESVKGNVLFINYTKATHWNNLRNADELETDDFLTIEFTRKDDQTIAAAVTKAITTYPPGITTMTTEMLARSLEQTGKDLPFILIDPRPLGHFDAAHLPGAVSIPLSRIKKRSPGLLPENKEARLIFYDQGAGGTEALNSAELARIAGYKDIHIYSDGIAGWIKSGRIAASSTAFIRKNKPGLIDLRDEGEFTTGHLKGAVNITDKKLPEMIDIFPTDKRVPIVFYGESDQQAVIAAKTVRVWGYRYVTIYLGGTTSWIESAETLSSEPTEQYVTSPGSTHYGQLRAKDFEMALISPVTVQIVDVRSSPDFTKGNFPESKHIPLQELPIRHMELSKEMIQVVFSSDDQRAEMAFDFLKQLGYRVNYLKGGVTFSNSGKYLVK